MLLAKPNQTLLEHSRHTRDRMADLIRRSLPVWQHRLIQLGIAVDNLESVMDFAAACHDLGKGTGPWQRYVRGQGPRLTHALFSMLMAKEVYRGEQDIAALAMFLAILSHHGQLHNGSFQDDRIAGLGRQSVDIESLNSILAELGLPSIAKTASFSGIAGQKVVALLQRKVASLKPLKLCFKSLYCLFHTQLRLADNEASANAAGGGGMITHHLPAVKGFSKSVVAISPNEIQRQASLATGNVILRAGCGVGKTGAALTFAMEKIQAGEADRLIFTLPTQFTSNSMYWDLTAKYGIPSRLRGLYHSEVESVLRLEPEAEKDSWVRQKKYQHTFYNAPVTVSTVDHLLYSLLHSYKYADRAFGNVLTSVVIFDEVHYYDHFTLDKIGQGLKLLRDLGIPHMIMTATMPDAVLNRLQEQAAGTYELITQREDPPARPYRVVKEKQPLIDAEGTTSRRLIALTRQHLGSKQMLVVNRVELAQQLANTLAGQFPQENIVCYHSRFCRRDRTDKELLIKALFMPVANRTEKQCQLIDQWDLQNNEGVILVCTQVCELSLDISADVMYSQAAPVDSIIQRGGRLHRKGKEVARIECNCPGCRERRYLGKRHQYCLYLFPLDWQEEKDFLPYYSAFQRDWLLRSWQVIEGDYTFVNAQTWVDQVYTASPELRDPTMGEMILEDVVFGRTPAERYGNEDDETSSGSFKVRDIRNSTVTAIPTCYEQEALATEDKFEISALGVRVPSWWFKEYGYEKNGLWFMDLPYSREFGFERRKIKLPTL